MNANGSMPDFLFGLGVAGADFPEVGRYYVVVDSGRDPFTGKSTARKYTLHSWVNDVKPPKVTFVTTRVSAGHPTIVVKVTDSQSGVDPFSLQLLITRRPTLSAASFDPKTGIAVLQVPRHGVPAPGGPELREARRLRLPGGEERRHRGAEPVPEHDGEGCAARGRERPGGHLDHSEQGRVPARSGRSSSSSRTTTRRSRPVGFFDGKRQIGRVRKNTAGLYTLNWSTAGKKHGAHVLTAIASDTRGREDRASRPVRICG